MYYGKPQANRTAAVRSVIRSSAHIESATNFPAFFRLLGYTYSHAYCTSGFTFTHENGIRVLVSQIHRLTSQTLEMDQVPLTSRSYSTDHESVIELGTITTEDGIENGEKNLIAFAQYLGG